MPPPYHEINNNVVIANEAARSQSQARDQVIGSPGEDQIAQSHGQGQMTTNHGAAKVEEQEIAVS